MVVNLFADFGVQPGSLQTDLVAASASTDSTAPTSVVTAPANGSVANVGEPIVISGTATDIEGVVAGVEVSVDNGVTWHPATGTTTWTYLWTPATVGSAVIRSRAVDDSINLEAPSSGVTVTVQPRTCPCSLWSTALTPRVPDEHYNHAVELGVKFTSDESGFVTKLRFYKGPNNTGTHPGHLWAADGTLLATLTFENETPSGWQEATFGAPVPITAGQTYIASYFSPTGWLAYDQDYFRTTGVENAPLHTPSSASAGGNGVYRDDTSGFPTQTLHNNYWVDVVFETDPSADEVPPVVSSTAPVDGGVVPMGTNSVSAVFSEPMDLTTISSLTAQLSDVDGNPVAATVSYTAGTRRVSLAPDAPFVAGGSYSVTLKGGGSGITDIAGNALTSDYSWAFSVAGAPSAAYTLWPDAATPGTPDISDARPIEVGTRFRADVAGTVTGLRFYKGPLNTGTHVGHLWSSTGTLLATATFSSESSSGWQEALLDTPVAIAAGTDYVVSYFSPTGNFAFDRFFFTRDVVSPPLRAPKEAPNAGNGVFKYDSTGFPGSTFGQGANYWVDVLFAPTEPLVASPPTVLTATPTDGSTGVSQSIQARLEFSELLDGTSVDSASVYVSDGAGNVVPAAVAYDEGRGIATITPNSPLAPNADYTITVKGGANGVLDRAGTPLAADFVADFTTSAPIHTLWDGTAVPGSDVQNAAPIELGTKFFSDVSGYVTGIRFFKGAQNTGTHVGHLWTMTGTQLAEVTFTGETASGWQEAAFDQPVAISAGTTYIVTYFSPTGWFAYSENYFLNNAVNHGSLHAPAAGGSGSNLNGNGVWFSGGSSFPNTSAYNNYWVDPVFNTTLPVLADPGPQTNAVGAVAALQLDAEDAGRRRVDVLG